MRTKKILSIALAILVATAAMFIPTSASAVSVNFIDATKTGTLNVYKYEMNDTSSATFRGTGESTDVNQVPVDATPLKGVTFKATRVADLVSNGNLNTTYYTTAGVSLPTVAEAKAMTAIATYTKTTDDNGYASFTELPLGIYLVQETNSPSNVTAKVDDFMVSVPMTNSDGNAWNYNVYVYPKNETRYTDVTIKKTDYLTGTALQGAVFTLEKKSEDSTWTSVETGLTTDSNGTVSPTTSLSINSYYKLVETTAPAGYIFDGDNNITNFYINENGEVCDADSKAVIDSNNPYLIVVNNAKPTISKRVGNNSTSMTYSANGQTFVFKISVKTPNIKDMSTLNTFKVVDKIDDCYTYVGNGTFTYNNAAATITDYCTFNLNKTTNTLTYTFDTSKLAPDTNIDINVVVKYNSNIKNHLGEAINNTAQLVYSTKTGTTDTNDVTNTINSNTVETHTSGFQFKKTTENGTTALAGATFKLYGSLNDAKNGVNELSVYTKSNTDLTKTVTSDSNGLVSIYGLAYGSANESFDTDSTTTYYLVETSAPDGYNLLAEPVAIEVGNDSWNYANTQFNVINSKKTVLPLTGGYGTAVFTVCGISLIFIGGILMFIARRKKKSSK